MAVFLRMSKGAYSTGRCAELLAPQPVIRQNRASCSSFIIEVVSVSRSKTSKRWLREHFDDPYVKKAQQEGYRSRAAYKLLELQEKDRLFKPGMTVVDLGAAPGGWSQVAARQEGHHGLVIASVVLAMGPIAGVEFRQGGFRRDSAYNRPPAAVGGRPVDLVMSDRAPNMSAVGAGDHPRGMCLAALALEMAPQVLKKD